MNTKFSLTLKKNTKWQVLFASRSFQLWSKMWKFWWKQKKKKKKVENPISHWNFFYMGNFQSGKFLVVCLASAIPAWRVCSPSHCNRFPTALTTPNWGHFPRVLIHRNVKPNRKSHSRLWIGIKSNLEHNVKECGKEKEKEEIKRLEWLLMRN